MRLTPESSARRRFFTDLNGHDAMWMDANSIETIVIDWSKKLGSDTISTSTFVSDGVTIDSSSNTTTTATVTISTPAGMDNPLVNHVVTASGLEYDKTIKVNEREM